MMKKRSERQIKSRGFLQSATKRRCFACVEIDRSANCRDEVIKCPSSQAFNLISMATSV